MQTYKITITGRVQGVGFRPFIYALAIEHNLKGYILNSKNGVEIVVNALENSLQKFIQNITTKLPNLAKIDSLSVKQIDKLEFSRFTIKESIDSSEVSANIPPDISICKECESELFDPSNRRYLYPFITCTNCGVRYSIIYDLPYDRDKTSMKFFKMCKACEAEYTNPLNRRYHAQPIGCWECGPTLSLWDKNNQLKIKNSELINSVVELIKRGNILAIKGVGGYHLVCDASNCEAIAKLRERKNRPSKPFAIMVKDIDMAKELAQINELEKKLLSSKERPIVILKQRLEAKRVKLSSLVAPKINRIGVFLPYTPLHLLILNKLNRPIVATSANFSDEPIATNFEAISKLNGVYDYLLEHNRDIVNGCDDSVVMVVKKQVITIRRARGYTPYEIELPFNLKEKTLALGANQKSTIAIGFANRAILSPHIGDLDSIESIEYYKQNIENLKRIYKFEPKIIACDMHPNYESTKVAIELKVKNEKLKINQVQHHFAHILGVMAENKIKSDVLGVAFDGTGLVDDGKLWGGEFLLCNYKGYKRIAHLKYFKLLGGEKAIKEPRRVALSLLFETFGKDALELDNPTIKAFSKSELNSLYIMWQKGLNAPLSSSMGRVFDGVASLLGVSQKISFEGESGMLLEELYNNDIKDIYPYKIEDKVIDLAPMIKELVDTQDKSIAVSKFFNTIVDIILQIHKEYNLPLVVSGGVFQNRILVELLLQKKPNIILAKKIPPNDGGVALGQLVFQVASKS